MICRSVTISAGPSCLLTGSTARSSRRSVSIRSLFCKASCACGGREIARHVVQQLQRHGLCLGLALLRRDRPRGAVSRRDAPIGAEGGFRIPRMPPSHRRGRSSRESRGEKRRLRGGARTGEVDDDLPQVGERLLVEVVGLICLATSSSCAAWIVAREDRVASGAEASGAGLAPGFAPDNWCAGELL